MTLVEFKQRAAGRYQRLLYENLFCGTVQMRNDRPLVSFTFDDFPRSALRCGGAILKKYGFRGTYYAALGLMGQHAPVGEIFSLQDLRDLLAEGHELGCHTYGHCHSWNTSASAFERSVLENRRHLQELLPGASFQSLSYPIAGPRPNAKRLVARHFTCCRLGGQTYNAGVLDRYLLRAYFLEKNRHDPDGVRKMIDRNSQVGGWLIFATHDVAAAPTPFGCTPEFFSDIVDYTARSGATVLPVGEAWKLVNR